MTATTSTTRSSDPILSVKHLSKAFGRRPKEVAKRAADGASRQDLAGLGTAAVIDASFDVAPGEIFVVMGLSGSGKSTLIRMLNGLLAPTDGSVSVAGTEIAGAKAATLRQVRQQSVSMVFQHFALFPHRTVLDNAAYALEVQGVPKAERIARAQRVIDIVGLAGWEHKLPGQLSGGMQQRVGLARALSADTPILLMDEAFSALDPLIRREMQEQLIDLQAELGKTIVFITHDLNEAMFLGDRIAVMRDGRIVQIGTPEDILTDPANDYVAQFVQDVDRSRVLTAASVMEPARAVVSASAGPRAALRAMRDLQTSGVFVVGRGRQLNGFVMDADAMRQVRAGSADLAAITRQDYTVVAPETSLADLFVPAVENTLPIAVADSEGRLLGVIPRVTMLAALGNVTQTGEIPLPPLTVPVSVISDTLRETSDGTEPAVDDAAFQEGSRA